MKLNVIYCTIIYLLLHQLGVVIGHYNYSSYRYDNYPTHYNRRDLDYYGNRNRSYYGSRNYGYNQYNNYNYYNNYNHYNHDYVTVDISNTFSTNKVEYTSNSRNDTDTFIPKGYRLISKVKDGDRVLWQTDGYKYAQDLTVQYDSTGKPRLRMNFTNADGRHGYSSSYGRHYGYGQRYGRDYDYSSDQEYGRDYDEHYEKPQIHLVGVNVKYRLSTEMVVYKKEGNNHKFIAKEPYLFCMVLRGNRILWTANSDDYPDTVIVKPTADGSNSLRFLYRDDRCYWSRLPSLDFMYDRGSYADYDSSFIKSTTIKMKRLYRSEDPDMLRFVFENSPLGSDKDKYQVYVLGRYEFFMYKINPGLKCTAIHWANRTYLTLGAQKIHRQFIPVWEYGFKFCRKHPIAVYLHTTLKLMFIEYSDKTYHFFRKTIYNGGWYYNSLDTVYKLDLNKVQLLTQADYKGSTLERLRTNKFKVYDLGFAYFFKFNYNARLYKFKYGNNVLYNYSIKDDNFNFPVAVYLMSDRSIEVIFVNRAFYYRNS